MYEGDAIEMLFKPEPTKLTLRAMADRGGAELKRRVEENTPVDSGELRRSWEQSPVRHRRATSVRGVDAYESEVSTDKEYAPHVEHGTGLYGPEHKKYLIEPKKPGGLLSWIDKSTGQRVFARRVWHPGSPGAHMMAYGAGKTEATMLTVLRPELEHWRAEEIKLFALARAGRH